MKRIWLLAMVVLFSVTALAEGKFLGTVTKIDMAGKDAKVATVTLKDESGKTIDITVTDKITLDKFADKRISVGDEVKAKYDEKDGKNNATYFKKPAGCS